MDSVHELKIAGAQALELLRRKEQIGFDVENAGMSSRMGYRLW